MKISRLVIREMLHRKLNFVLGVLSIVFATGCLVAQLTLLKAHDLDTEQILADRQAAADERLGEMEDDYRKIMKDMGFNLLILPAGQEEAPMGTTDLTMPENYVKKLAGSKIMTVRHLLPILYQNVFWPERKRSIYLVGTRGEVPLLHRNPKKPIQVAVPPGEVVVGYDLWKTLGIKVGDKITILGRDFTVARCQDEWDLDDDRTIWMDLAGAQELLGKEGLINVIQALKCHCAGAEMESVRTEIMRIVPGTRVKMLANKVTARARARDRAGREHVEAMAAEKLSRSQLRGQRERFAAFLAPVVIVACAAWIALLALGNVRERRAEIGILRAIGVRSKQIFTLFLSKALLIGFGGAAVGYILGVGVGAVWGGLGLSAAAARLFDWRVFASILIVAPLLSAAASWTPALLASRQDPATVLSNE